MLNFYGSKLVTRIGSLAKALVGTYMEKEFKNNRVFYEPRSIMKSFYVVKCIKTISSFHVSASAFI